jgi:hypothetical protein
MALALIQNRYDALKFDPNEKIDKLVRLRQKTLTKREFSNLFLQLRGSNRSVRDANTDEITVEDKTLDEIYNDYVLANNTYWQNQVRTPGLRKNLFQQVINIDYENDFPFKSKTVHPSFNPPDFKLKPSQKLFRPYFSPKLGN